MPTLVADIKSTNWQISTAGFGLIAQGLADIRQCIDLILRTAKGSDNLRPEFGSDIFRYVDYPVNQAVPNIKRCIIEALGIWEKRITIVSITHLIVNEQIYFFITYKLVDQDLIDSIFFNGDGGTTDTTGLILQAFYPPNPYGLAYRMDLELNDKTAVPDFPGSGFSTLSQLFAWVSSNWASYGRWVQLSDRIVLYANSEYTTGSISISLIAGLLKVEALIPTLEPGESYGIDFLPDGGLPAPAAPTGLLTPEQLLMWVQANWASYGTWSVQSGAIDVFGDFNPMEFSGDFNIGGSLTNYYLVLDSTVLYTATLTIDPV
jgi:phage baseplate assembly protein W